MAVSYECSGSMLKEKPAENILLVPGEHITKGTRFFEIFLTKRQPFNNYEKCFLFHLRSSFHSEDIQILVFPSSPLFLPVNHCFRG